MYDFIDLKSQYLLLKNDIDKSIADVLMHGKYIMGPEVVDLETKLAEFAGVNHCVTVSSGTEALLISLMTIGIRPGDEVITTPFTFVATAEVIALLGAVPVYVDIEIDTCNIDATKIESAITAKTKAIIPVSLYGQPANMTEINQIALNHKLVVIEDAAQSFGSHYKGIKSCNLSHIGCTSFFPSKPLGCYGDGGAIFTNNADYAQIMREIRVHGQKERYVHVRVGVGGRMDTLQCAVVLSKLSIFDQEITKRIEIGTKYNQAFDDAGIDRIQVRSDRTSMHAQYTIFVAQRDVVRQKLERQKVPTAVHYPIALHLQPAYQQAHLSESSFPNALSAAHTVMSIPMHPYLSEEDQDTIIKHVVTAVQETSNE